MDSDNQMPLLHVKQSWTYIVNVTVHFSLILDRNVKQFLLVLSNFLDSFSLVVAVYFLYTWAAFLAAIFNISSFISIKKKKISNSTPFYPTQFLWKSKVPPKVMAFAQLVTHKKININDMLQLRKPFKALSFDWCILCRRSRKRLIISSYILRLLWDYGIGFSYRQGWRGFSQTVFVI